MIARVEKFLKVFLLILPVDKKNNIVYTKFRSKAKHFTR